MSRFTWLRPWFLAFTGLSLCACHGGGGDDDDDGGSTAFTVGGTVTGLSGALVLRLNGANDLTLGTGASIFTFSPQLASGTSYTVGVAANPIGQVCALVGNTGTIASANVTNVAVTCFTFSIGGTVTGLTKPGLVLTVNNGNDLAVPAQASSFVFPPSTQLGPALGLYGAAIKTQPAGQTCTIIRTTGGVTPAVATVSGALGPAVDCVDNVTGSFVGTYSVADDTDTDARGYVTFFADGTYLLGVHNDEPACVSNGNGIQYGVYNWNQATQVLRIVKHAPIGLADDCGFDVGTTVTLSKDDDGTIALIEYDGTVPRYAGTLAAVPSTAGALIGSWGVPHAFVVFSSDNRFFLATARAFVQVPDSFAGIEHGCYTVAGTNTSGSLSFNLTASCTVGGGQSAVDTTGSTGFSANATPVNFTVNADVMQSIAGAPTSPFIGAAPRIQATQLPSTHSIGATISGLTGTGLTLQYNGKSGPALAAGTTTTVIAIDVPTQTAYAVAIRQQPTGQYCTVASGSGIVFANVSNVAVTCTTIPGTTYLVGGSITNLLGTGLALRLNGQVGGTHNVAPAAAATSYAFGAPLQMGSPFAVTVVGQPSSPTTQFCFPTTPAGGTIVASNASVNVQCVAIAPYTVTGTVGGLAASTSVGLRLEYTDGAGVAMMPVSAAVNANGVFNAFTGTTIPAYGAFDIGIVTQPAGQTCTIVKARGLGLPGVIGSATVACVANTTDPLRGTYSGLDADQRRWYFNFNADGTYTTAMIHNEWGCGTGQSPQNIGNGIEYGVYKWIQATGQFQLPVPAAIDTNGSCGFSSPGGAGFGGFITRVGNSIEVRETAGGPLLASVPAVQSNAGTLVGGWTREAGNGSLLVFHADGTFAYVETQLATLYPGLYGQERGCYNPPSGTPSGTITFTIDANCRPDDLASYDMNAFGGLLAVPVVTSATWPYSLSGDTLTLNGLVYKRTQPN